VGAKLAPPLLGAKVQIVVPQREGVSAQGSPCRRDKLPACPVNKHVEQGSWVAACRYITVRSVIKSRAFSMDPTLILVKTQGRLLNAGCGFLLANKKNKTPFMIDSEESTTSRDRGKRQHPGPNYLSKEAKIQELADFTGDSSQMGPSRHHV